MKIAVAGGTGTVGAHVVDVARTRGHDVVVLTRATGVDLVSGAGLDAALVGADAVIDVVSVSTLDAKESVAFFEATTRALLAAEEAASVGHHVALSIVGIDRAPRGLLRGQARPGAARRGRARAVDDPAGDAVPRVRGADARARQGRAVPRRSEDADAAGRGARGRRATRRPRRGRTGRAGCATSRGPREESLVDMVRSYARAGGSRAWIPAVPLPGALGRAQRDGSLLPGADADRGVQTYAEWLAAR